MRKLWSESGTGIGSGDRAWYWFRYQIALVVPVPVPAPVRNSVPVGSYFSYTIEARTIVARTIV